MELFGFKIIVHQLGDRQHKYIIYLLVGQWIKPLLGDNWYK